MPYQREAEVVLAIWRDLERRLEDLEDGTPEAEEIQADVLRLRNEYRRLIDEALAHHRPVPPPFPEEP